MSEFWVWVWVLSVLCTLGGHLFRILVHLILATIILQWRTSCELWSWETRVKPALPTSIIAGTMACHEWWKWMTSWHNIPITVDMKIHGAMTPYTLHIEPECACYHETIYPSHWAWMYMVSWYNITLSVNVHVTLVCSMHEIYIIHVIFTHLGADTHDVVHWGNAPKWDTASCFTWWPWLFYQFTAYFTMWSGLILCL